MNTTSGVLSFSGLKQALQNIVLAGKILPYTHFVSYQIAFKLLFRIVTDGKSMRYLVIIIHRAEIHESYSVPADC